MPQSGLSFGVFMTVVAILALGAALVLFATGLRKGGDFFSPARLFGTVWGVAIFLTELKLSGFQHTWTFYSWIIFAVGILAFLLGSFIVYVIVMRHPLLSLNEVRARLQDQGKTRINERSFFRVIVILFAAYVGAFATETVIEGTVPLFSPRPDLLRTSFGVFGLHLIVNAVMGVLLLAVEYLLVAPRVGKRKMIVGLIILVCLGSYFTLLQRYTFVVIGLIVLAMAYFTTRRVRPLTVVPVVGMFVTGMFWINFIRSARYIREYIYYTSRMKFSRELWILAEPYMYVTMNLENFARGVDRLDHFTYGYLTFDWILALAGLKHWMEEYFGIVRLPYLISGYNTFTFHWLYYYDFGPIGVAILPLLTGLVVAWWYYRLRIAPDLLTMMLYCCSVAVIVLSFIMNPLSRLDFVSNILIIWFVHRFLINRARPAPQSPAIAGR